MSTLLEKRGSQARIALAMAILAAAVCTFVVLGCGSSESDGGQNGSSSPSATVSKSGGNLKIAVETPGSIDPVLLNDTGGIILAHNVYEGLVEIDEQLEPQPLLATTWESSPDGRTWTVTLRDGVTFHNGDVFDSADVLYSFKRLRDPDLGGATVSLFSGVTSIKATDASHVVFSYKEPNPEFAKDLGDYHVLMMSDSVADPAKETVGTGPFSLTSYGAEDRAVLTRSGDYWMKDSDGQPLPYLETLELVFSPDPGAQVEALRGGQVQFMYNLPAEMVATVEAEPELVVMSNVGNAHFGLRIRSDEGHIGSNVKLRQALQMGTDHEAILQFAREGLGVVGNNTPVGPMYGDYYLDQPPVYDPEGAKKLLAEAGYADGLKITLIAQRYASVPAIATVWKEQMKKLGVDVNVQVVPGDVWYGDGDQSWLVADFGITDWATRATPVTYFNLAYVSDGAWNESHWSDPEFDKVVAEINREMDAQKRADLYKQAQSILIERGPQIIFYVEESKLGMSKAVQGWKLYRPESASTFRSVYMVQ